MNRTSVALIAAFLFSTVASAEPANWPQFRGPSGQGVSELHGLPLTWSEKENVKWKTPIHGRAWSCPVVWENQIWLPSATDDGRELFAICVDRDSGRIIYDRKLFDVPNPQYRHPFNSYASPTPAIEAGRVYVTFGSPGTACLDTQTGKVLWERRDFVCNHYRGAGSSPVIFNNLLIMNFDGSDFQFIVALDKNTGKTVWRTDRSMDYQDLDADGKPKEHGDWRKGYSTPRIVSFDGAPPICLSLASKAMYAYDPTNGHELWRVENRNSHSGSATPVVGMGMIFINTGFGRGELWAVRPGGSGVVTDTHVAWKVKRNSPNKPSVLFVDDLIYMVDDAGIASCVEAMTGKDVWRNRIEGNYSASPLYADGRIYFFSEEGKTTVIEPGRTFKVLAENELEDGFMASPAVIEKGLILRTRTSLYRVEAGR
jgi:outer membrane protein assembly factor BamB